MFDDISFHFLVKPESRIFTRINPDTHKTETRSLNLSEEDEKAWVSGVPLQYVSNFISDSDRHWLITGSTKKTKDTLYGQEYVPYWVSKNVSDKVKELELATNPRFLEPTGTIYAKMPISSLLERSASSHYLNSLLEYLPKGAIIAGGFMSQLVEDMLLSKEPSVEITTDNYGRLKEKHDIGPKTHLQQKDVDIFFTSEKAFRETLELCLCPPSSKDAWAWRNTDYNKDQLKILNSSLSNSLRFFNFDSIDNKPSLQLIKLAWYKDPEHVIDTFDFTCVQFATDGENLYFNPASTFDLSRKRLVLHRMQFPASTLRRMIKYGNRGFYTCPGSLVKISQEILKANQDGIEDEENFVYLD